MVWGPENSTERIHKQCRVGGFQWNLVAFSGFHWILLGELQGITGQALPIKLKPHCNDACPFRLRDASGRYKLSRVRPGGSARSRYEVEGCGLQSHLPPAESFPEYETQKVSLPHQTTRTTLYGGIRAIATQPLMYSTCRSTVQYCICYTV